MVLMKSRYSDIAKKNFPGGSSLYLAETGACILTHLLLESAAALLMCFMDFALLVGTTFFNSSESFVSFQQLLSTLSNLEPGLENF